MKRCLPVLCIAVALFLPACPKSEQPSTTATNATTSAASPKAPAPELVLFQDRNAQGVATQATDSALQVTVSPGSDAEADEYYNAIRPSLGNDFPKAKLQDSNISDMLNFFGFPALPASDIERLDPAVLMDFEKLRRNASDPNFEAAYRANPLRTGELVAARFFAPKIINVSDPQVNGVPKGGFGWRKVIRFRARDASKARTAGLDSFFLLFNFTTEAPKFPPPTAHAAQLQGILQPIYPTAGKHRDLYFLVYEAIDKQNVAEKIGKFLTATFDLVSSVPDGKYYVPTACAQCHGSEEDDQKGAKVNYLDTDHWIDRTDADNDFPKVSPNDVLVDGVPSYATYRTLNSEIETQNAAAGSANFALLATRKWLDLHKVGSATETSHVPPLGRGFVDAAGDPVWTAGATPDQDLLPLLNRYCFRCHSSVRFHVFQKKAVIQRKSAIVSRLKALPPATRRMPQDRILDATTLAKLIDLINKLQ